MGVVGEMQILGLAIKILPMGVVGEICPKWLPGNIEPTGSAVTVAGLDTLVMVVMAIEERMVPPCILP